MLECRKCRATWPDSLIDNWGETEQTAGYGPEPFCVNLVPARGNAASNEVCRGRLLSAADPEDTKELLLLSPIGDAAQRDKADRHNQERRDALRQGK